MSRKRRPGMWCCKLRCPFPTWSMLKAWGEGFLPVSSQSSGGCRATRSHLGIRILHHLFPVCSSTFWLCCEISLSSGVAEVKLCSAFGSVPAISWYVHDGKGRSLLEDPVHILGAGWKTSFLSLRLHPLFLMLIALQPILFSVTKARVHSVVTLDQPKCLKSLEESSTGFKDWRLEDYFKMYCKRLVANPQAILILLFSASVVKPWCFQPGSGELQFNFIFCPSRV